MRTNRLFCFKKAGKQVNNEAEKIVKTQEMGNQVSNKSRQRSSSQNDAKLEMAKYNCPRTEKITSTKPEVAMLKRRRSYSECDNLANERQTLCKKLRVNQLYTDYCGRNSFMAAFFRLLGKFNLTPRPTFFWLFSTKFDPPPVSVFWLQRKLLVSLILTKLI